MYNKKFLRDNRNKTLKEVGKQLNVSKQRVHQIYKSYGIDRKKSLIKEEKVKRAISKAKSNREAAELLEISDSRLKVLCEMYGIELPKERRKREERELNEKGQQRCTKCEMVLAKTEFYKGMRICKLCGFKVWKNSYLKHRSKRIATASKWQREKRARLQSGG